MAAPLIIGLVGMPASGKTVVAEYLAKKPDAMRIHFGDFIWNYLAKRGVKPTEEMGMMAGLFMWAEYGDIPLADWANNLIKNARGKKLIILDSLRTSDEAQYFQAKYPEKFHVIAVLTSPAIRLKREQSRGRFGKVTKLEFRMRDREELMLGVGDLIASSSHYIDANKSVPEMQKQADAILKQIL